MDLEFDSLSRIELLSKLEKQFNICFPTHLVPTLSTVKELVFAINELSTKNPEATQTAEKQALENIWKNITTTNPTKKITNKIDIAPNWFAKTINILFCFSLYIISKIMWRIKISGTTNLPKDKSFILCPNHNSYLDGFLIAAALPNWLRSNIFFLGYSTYFDTHIIRHLVKIGKIIPIDPATNLTDAIRASGYVLRHNKAICLFPEGGRSPDGSIQPFKKGVGILAHELNIPLIPVHIDGAFDALPREKCFPSFHRIKITFGTPYSPAQLKEKGTQLGIKDDYEAITIGIQEEVTNLAQK
jgi:long-chain acyl-CoA synthetase